jgi:CheY-like chemotaxis protein
MHEEVPVQGITTVVYIEADRANALLMQALLGSRAGYRLHHAIDGISGINLCRRVRPDMVITEMQLPDMTGYEILLALRGNAATECLPCIVLSGDAMPDHITQALAAGFDDYWTKPIDIWKLLQRIDDAAANACLRLNRHMKAASATYCRHPACRLEIGAGAMLRGALLPT